MRLLAANGFACRRKLFLCFIESTLCGLVTGTLLREFGLHGITFLLEANDGVLALHEFRPNCRDFLLEFLHPCRVIGIGRSTARLFEICYQAGHLRFLPANGFACREQLLLCFIERQLRVAQCAIRGVQLLGQTLRKRLCIGDLVGVVEILTESGCVSLQVQCFQQVLLHAESLLVEIAEFLFCFVVTLLGRFFVPHRCLGVIDRHVVHAGRIDSRNVILRLGVSVFRRSHPALQ